MNWQRKTAAYLLSQSITLFGSSLVQFAIIWYIARETSSGVYVTLSIIFAFAPQVLVSLFAGVWADRYDRKLLILCGDGGIALATLVLALTMLRGMNFLWAMLLISAIRSVGTGIQMPAVNAMLPQLVPADKLMQVNGINGSLQSVINLVSPALAAAILSYGQLYHILFIDVITAAIGIGILLCIRIPLHKKAQLGQHGGYFDELKAGIRYCLQHRFIKRLMVACMIYMILIVPCAFLNVLLVTRTFGDSYWYLTANEMVFFIGAAAGGLILGAWGGFKNRMATLSLGVVAFGLLTFLVGFCYDFSIYLGLMLLIGIVMPFGSTPLMVLLQEKVAPDMQGRVFGLYQIIFSAFLPVGTAIFGPLADVVSIQSLMIVSGMLLIVFGLVLRGNPALYREGISSVNEPEAQTPPG